VPKLLRYGAVILTLALVSAACSGGSSTEPVAEVSADNQTTSTVEIDPLPAATSSTTTTSEAPLPEETTTTMPAGPVAPLTGLPVDAELTSPAVVIKIDNHTNARPQWGLNAADIVYEEVVEGGITRFAAVFHSADSDPVGPVRSARTSDFDLLEDKNTPLFGNSGGNTGTLRLLRNVDAISVSFNALPDLYYRERSRSRPHNLMTSTADLVAARGAEGGVPPPMFTYRSAGDELPDSAVPIEGITIDYGARLVTYDWDAEVDGWRRTQNGSDHVDADGVQVAPTNVVVQIISYGRSPADPSSPEAVLVGSGEVWMLVDGNLIEGIWTRDSASEVTTYTLEDGTPIDLDPGRTWVALPRVGQTSSR